jgi:uncharacterized protein (UPF0548 family)
MLNARLAVRKPTANSILSFLSQQEGAEFTYPEVGATAGQLPGGYAINHARRRLGQGLQTYELACRALQSWQQLRLGWVDCWPTEAPLIAGANIAVIGKALGLFWLNACRIAYVTEERADCFRFSYAHGTLPAHLAIGEERFMIEMDARDEVTIDILSFSKPSTFAARLGYPLIRRSQQRFVHQSAAHVQELVVSVLHQQHCRTRVGPNCTGDGGQAISA